MNCLEQYHRGQKREMVGGDPDGPQYTTAKSFLESHPELQSVGTLSKDEWEAITLYLVFAFKKLR